MIEKTQNEVRECRDTIRNALQLVMVKIPRYLGEGKLTGESMAELVAILSETRIHLTREGISQDKTACQLLQRLDQTMRIVVALMGRKWE